MILDFLELHRAEQNEARHDLMLGLLDRVTHGTDNSGVRLWTLGSPSECATQTSPRNAIILGELNQSNSRSGRRNARSRLSRRARQRSGRSVVR
jgi:hypothetical protein